MRSFGGEVSVECVIYFFTEMKLESDKTDVTRGPFLGKGRVSGKASEQAGSAAVPLWISKASRSRSARDSVTSTERLPVSPGVL